MVVERLVLCFILLAGDDRYSICPKLRICYAFFERPKLRIHFLFWDIIDLQNFTILLKLLHPKKGKKLNTDS